MVGGRCGFFVVFRSFVVDVVVVVKVVVRLGAKLVRGRFVGIFFVADVGVLLVAGVVGVLFVVAVKFGAKLDCG